jgi:putative hemolysin
VGGIGLEASIILVLVIANGVFAMAEIAILSARKARLQQMANDGNRKAAAALELANDPEEFLSTVQIGITFISTMAGAFGGARIAEKLAVYLRQYPVLAPHSNTISLAVVVTVIAYISLILGELVPKRIALTNPEKLGSFIAGPMRLLSRAALPAVSFLSWSTKIVMKFIPVRPGNEPPITEEEIHVLIHQGTQHGTFEPEEQQMVQGVFRLADRKAVELMTPRHKIVWLNDEAEWPENKATLQSTLHSRFPVGEGSLDKIVGYINAKDLLAQDLSGNQITLRPLQQPLFIPETSGALSIINRFQESGVHFALVINEHGSVEGLLTTTDILEAIVGKLPDAGEPEPEQIVRRDDGSLLVDGMLPIADLKRALKISSLPGEDEYGFATVGGFAMSELGKIPSVGDNFQWDSFRLEVLDMDGNRVDKVLISPVAPSAEESLPA